MANRNDDDKGLLWKLPAAYSTRLGKLGPAFGLGTGCGIGFGVGLIGGAGLGLGFGYGAGRGIAYDENKKHSNVGRVFSGQGSLPIQ